MPATRHTAMRRRSATKNATMHATMAPNVTARKRTRNFSRSVADSIFTAMRLSLVFMSAKIHAPQMTIANR